MVSFYQHGCGKRRLRKQDTHGLYVAGLFGAVPVIYRVILVFTDKVDIVFAHFRENISKGLALIGPSS